MSSDIQLFRFDELNASLRVQVDEAGQPWFNASDVCAALELGNARQAIDTHVDSDDVQKLDAIDSLGRNQRSNHVNESGLYSLILGSTKDAAKRFKRWVTSEVLPSIRKTGGYHVAQSAQSPALFPELAAQLEAVVKTAIKEEVKTAIQESVAETRRMVAIEVRNALASVAPKRAEFPKWQKKAWYEFIFAPDGRNGYCPITRKSLRGVRMDMDHISGATNNGIKDGWMIDAELNNKARYDAKLRDLLDEVAKSTIKDFMRWLESHPEVSTKGSGRMSKIEVIRQSGKVLDLFSPSVH